MRISLVITTYNSENYIEEAIKSALNQVRKPDEIIICDDNSTDKTISICNKYLKHLSIHINPQGPSGFTNAFNYALKLGVGDFVTILHYDDILHPNFLQQAEIAINKFPGANFLITKNFYFDKESYLDFKAYSEYQYINSVKLLSGKAYSIAYLNGVDENQHLNRCPGTVFQRTLTEKIIFRREAGLICDDDLFYRVGAFTEVIQLDLPLVGVRLHNESESGNMDDLSLNSELANSYFFLVSDWSSNSIIGKQGLDSFIKRLAKFNFRRLYYALQTNNEFQIANSVDKYKALSSLYPKESRKIIKFYQKAFFYLAEKDHISFLKMAVKGNHTLLKWLKQF